MYASGIFYKIRELAVKLLHCLNILVRQDKKKIILSFPGWFRYYRHVDEVLSLKKKERKEMGSHFALFWVVFFFSKLRKICL
jgi:hypothetical protein